MTALYLSSEDCELELECIPAGFFAEAIGCWDVDAWCPIFVPPCSFNNLFRSSEVALRVSIIVNSLIALFRFFCMYSMWAVNWINWSRKSSILFGTRQQEINGNASELIAMPRRTKLLVLQAHVPTEWQTFLPHFHLLFFEFLPPLPLDVCPGRQTRLRAYPFGAWRRLFLPTFPLSLPLPFPGSSGGLIRRRRGLTHFFKWVLPKAQPRKPHLLPSA